MFIGVCHDDETRLSSPKSFSRSILDPIGWLMGQQQAVHSRDFRDH
jgi:hypothetical protein